MVSNIVKLLFKSIERLLRSRKIQERSRTEGIFVLDGLRKKYLTRCQNFRSKTVYMQFNKKCFPKDSEGFFQIILVPP